MYKIRTSTDQPDAAILKSSVEQMMQRGIRVEKVARDLKDYNAIVEYSWEERK